MTTRAATIALLLLVTCPAVLWAQQGRRGRTGTPGREVPAQQVRRISQNALAEVMPQGLELREVLWNQPVRLPRGDVDARGYLEGEEPVNDRLRARIELFVGDESVRTIRVRLLVRDRRDVVVVTRRLRPGDTVDASDLALRPLPPGVRVRRPLRSIADAVGQEITRIVDSGEVLQSGSLRAPTAVRRRERVRIIARIGGIEVVAQGEPLQDGAIGEVIRVMCLSTRRTIDARVSRVGEVVAQ